MMTTITGLPASHYDDYSVVFNWGRPTDAAIDKKTPNDYLGVFSWSGRPSLFARNDDNTHR